MLFDPDGWVYLLVCPELRQLKSDAEKKRAVKHTKEAIMARRWFWTLVALYTIAAIAGWGLFERLITPTQFFAYALCYVAAVTAVYILLFTWIYGVKLRRTVRSELVKSGIPVCIGCGYSLTGLTRSRCPECGEAFDPRLLDK